MDKGERTAQELKLRALPLSRRVEMQLFNGESFDRSRTRATFVGGSWEAALYLRKNGGDFERCEWLEIPDFPGGK